ncbi:carbohydrate ABC transporter permease [Bacillus sp. P14.5]|uniref:carbohydrate ABC transporter permease n=1 Tax=Bacillus sp. P14.5 TaxID=1983400 RepID=UPI000DE9F759|nr:carbohydrate ABC transporter permease [Bacillus sp. P14.5]
MKKRLTAGDIIFNLFNYSFMLLLGILMFFPFVYIFSYSLSDPNTLPNGLIFFPSGFNIDSYVVALSSPAVLNGILISILRTLIGPAVMIFFTSMAAYVLTRDDLFAVKFFRRFFVFTLYISSGLIPVYLLVQSLNLTGSFWIYIVPAAVGVFNLVLIKTYIESLPKSLEDAALVDGANEFVLFWKVIFPVIKPVVAAVMLFSAVGQWNAFIDTQIYNAMNPELFPLQYVLYETLNSTTAMENSSDLVQTVTPKGLKMAITMITVLPILIIYPFLQKHFAKGLMIGSIKG